MNTINSFNVTGWLVSDPAVKYNNDLCIANYRVAVRRPFRKEGQPEADYFDVTSFGKQGEFVEKYGKKGTKLEISGRMQSSSWKEENGEKREKVTLISEKVEFAESRASQQQSQQAVKSEPRQQNSSESFMSVPDTELDKLPFN